jgi:hypothetical protein
MKRLQGMSNRVLAVGFIGFLTFGTTASAELVSSEQIVQALTAPPKELSPKIGDGANRASDTSWKCWMPSFLSRTSDALCPRANSGT